MPPALNLIGERFGRLVVVARLGTIHGRVYWSARCDCGNETKSSTNDLRSGDSKSCGCLRADTLQAARLKHGESGYVKTPEYRAWLQMKQRCYNPRTRCFDRYGGRGIKVCDRWLESFVDFLADMGRRPEQCTTIDRIDNDGDYTPRNCAWATNGAQARNRSSNRAIEFRGETLLLVEWVERLGLRYETVRYRLNRGWAAEDAFTKPSRYSSSRAAKP